MAHMGGSRVGEIIRYGWQDALLPSCTWGAQKTVKVAPQIWVHNESQSLHVMYHAKSKSVYVFGASSPPGWSRPQSCGMNQKKWAAIQPHSESTQYELQ